MCESFSGTKEFQLGTMTTELAGTVVGVGLATIGAVSLSHGLGNYNPNDLSDMLSCCVFVFFGGVFTLVGLLFVIRSISPPKPLRIEWNVDSLNVDTGYPGLMHMLHLFETKRTRNMLELVRKRRLLHITLGDVRSGRIRLDETSRLTFNICSTGAKCFELGWSVRVDARDELLSPIRNWLANAAEPCHAR